ncbi:hypothetical protein D9619_004115 [Psilocybe cf. subviscida]|uniref:Glucose-methanol-choline oxidoreductase N-terminal domain-containing protein n=1 Tax=Psilocybe cf. subviscida TaxID=2480587 RepID=A0A8H5F8M6_9AGAR|nr:hypothetical protein D9619_004115 [Psilocybe cf. subviscida]
MTPPKCLLDRLPLSASFVYLMEFTDQSGFAKLAREDYVMFTKLKEHQTPSNLPVIADPSCSESHRMNAPPSQEALRITSNGFFAEFAKGPFAHLNSDCTPSRTTLIERQEVGTADMSSQEQRSSKLAPTPAKWPNTSSQRGAMYTRAAASDYDDWETAETYQPESSNDTHGASDPIKVSFAKVHCNVGTNFLEVAVVYDKDHPLTDDINIMHEIGKYGRPERLTDTSTKEPAAALTHPITTFTIKKRPPVDSFVRKRNRGTKAVGIEFMDDSVGRRGGGADAPVKSACVSRLVVVSAGAFGSPSILERSGIGAKSVLEKNAINQIVDLPGVGENYMDHNVAALPFVGSEDSETVDLMFRGTEDELTSHAQQWVSSGSGQMAQNGLNAGIKLQPNAKELAAMSPEFDNRWERTSRIPQTSLLSFVSNPNVPRGKYYSMAYFSGYPVSPGSVHIAGGLNPYTPLDFYAGFLDDPADVVILRWAYKKFREIARRMKFFRGEVISGHPTFPPGSAATTAVASGPIDINAPDIVYTEEDDAAIDEYHRKYNCSITPGNVGANTNNAAIAIGEKAAVIIAEDLGIKGITPA